MSLILCQIVLTLESGKVGGEGDEVSVHYTHTCRIAAGMSAVFADMFLTLCGTSIWHSLSSNY